MQVNPDMLRVVEKWPWKGGSMIAMHSIDSGWRILAEADSQEEMDLKLASMGLETDWAGRDRNDSGWSKYQHRVRRVS